MYGFAPFATLYGHTYHDPHLNLTSAYHQLQLIHTHCRHNATGLLVHGYDASRRAPWADPVTGASPVVWGRSLAWYTVGLVDALEIASAATAAASSNPTTVSARRSLVVHRMRTLFHQLAVAEIAALRHSVRETGRAGVWQVVDMPGRADNFVEASATALLTYALAKGIRLGFFLLDEEEEKKEDDDVADEIQSATYARPRKGSKNALHILRATYDDLVAHFVVPTHNNTLNFTGTSTIASLSVPKPDYYVRYLSVSSPFFSFLFFSSLLPISAAAAAAGMSRNAKQNPRGLKSRHASTTLTETYRRTASSARARSCSRVWRWRGCDDYFE